METRGKWKRALAPPLRVVGALTFRSLPTHRPALQRCHNTIAQIRGQTARSSQANQHAQHKGLLIHMQSKRRAPDAVQPADHKRTRTGLALAACNRCRQSKRRCDSARPSCSNCQQRNADCQYETISATESRTQAIKRERETIQTSQETARNSIDWLRMQSQETALSCLERLRHSSDPMGELCSIASTERSRRLPLQIPPQEVMLATSPSLNSMLDVELSLNHPGSFPVSLDEPRNLSMGSLPDLSTFLNSQSSQHRSIETSGVTLPGFWTPDPDKKQDLIDKRLWEVKIRYWSPVPVSDRLAAELFSAFLKVELPVYGFFDPDLFVRDLVTQDTRFCSSLLVNLVLFWASCSFGPIYSGASELSEAFLHSAQRLLEADQTSPTHLTVASLAILSISMITFGKDDLAKRYMALCIRMGEEMHLYGSARYRLEQIDHSSTSEASMLSYVAWSAFNVSGVYALHFHDLASETFTKFPPLLPKPGPTQDGREGVSFPSFCQFRCIAHDMAAVYYSSPGPIHEHVPLAFAEAKFRSLLKWAEDLPPDCRRQTAMSHNVAEMHICYHATIMDVFRPFLSQPHLLSTFASDPQRPIAIFALSYAHLKELTAYYHKTFAGTPFAHTISWVHGPLYIAPTILRYDKTPNCASEFLACILACAPVIASHKILEGAVKALFSVAVSAGVFDVQQAVAHIGLLTEGREGRLSVGGGMETGFVIDQDAAMESRGTAVGDVLIRKLDEMVLADASPVAMPERGVMVC